MPKLGMEPIRRAALVKATIDEIGAVGNLDVTVSNIAKRAGMSSALANRSCRHWAAMIRDLDLNQGW